MSTDTDEEKHSGMSGLIDKAQDAVGGMVGMASAMTAGANSAVAFVTNAAIGDLYEVEAGAIALRRARSPELRSFAAMMTEHHTTSMHQLRSALRMHEAQLDGEASPPPMELDNRRQGMIDHLVEAPDDEFEKRYLAQQTLAHQETLTLLRGYGEKGDNPQLASFARGGAPMVERHLKMLRTMGSDEARGPG